MPRKIFQRAFDADKNLMYNLNIMENVMCHPLERRWPSRDHMQMKKTIMNSKSSKRVVPTIEKATLIHINV